MSCHFLKGVHANNLKKVVVFVKRYLVIGESSFDGSQRYVFSKRNQRFRISDLLSGFEFSNVSEREC